MFICSILNYNSKNTQKIIKFNIILIQTDSIIRKVNVYQKNKIAQSSNHQNLFLFLYFNWKSLSLVILNFSIYNMHPISGILHCFDNVLKYSGFSSNVQIWHLKRIESIQPKNLLHLNIRIRIKIIIIWSISANLLK
jgi:hypothetical protein